MAGTIRARVGRGAEGLRKSAGSWKDLVDADKLIKNIYTDRLISTRLEPRL